ncbi:hypothetical protein llg_05540 [Luteolibacter sp. LG18]|nr:hypothetical protein llg_05540 [Luteolibacter sp. LG18]
MVCHKASEELIPISAALGIHTCDRHWGWSWAISFGFFMAAIAVAVSMVMEPDQGFRGWKAWLIVCAAPWMVWQFARSWRARRVIAAERAARREAERCQGERIAPSREVDRG